MMQLHYYPGTASMTPHILLQEIGAPFELVLVDRLANAHKTPAYLKLNPNGLIPVLTDGELARHGGPWLLGEDYSALDPFAMMLCRWTRGFTSAPARSRPHLGPYLQRVLARPAVQRALATEQLAPPWV